MVFLSPVGSARRSGPFDPPPSLPMDSRYVRHYDITTTPPPPAASLAGSNQQFDYR